MSNRLAVRYWSVRLGTNNLNLNISCCLFRPMQSDQVLIQNTGKGKTATVGDKAEVARVGRRFRFSGV